MLTKKHERFYKEELQHVPGIQKIMSPHDLGTLPAILRSLLRIFRADENALVAFFPSDHYFPSEHAFNSTVEGAFDFVDGERDTVILLGGRAKGPETEYC